MAKEGLTNTNRKIIVVAVIGLVVGLALGIFISAIFNLPNVILPTQSGAGNNNQVQVSGTVQKTQTGTIYFLQLASFYDNDSIKTSSPIKDGKYSVLLVGGQSYDIFIDRYPRYSSETPDYTLYVPSGATTFTANF
jgi:hypothetical protein